MAFNQLRQGTIGSGEIFLASKGAMPITGLPGKPTTQGKNGRSHQTLQLFLEADRPGTLEQLRERIKHYRQHYNHCESCLWLVWDWLAGWVAAVPPPRMWLLQSLVSKYLAVDLSIHRAWSAGTCPAHIGSLIRRLSSSCRGVTHHGAVPT